MGSYSRGVPVKNYIVQSAEFAICAAVLFDIAITRASVRQWMMAAGALLLALAFLADILFVVTSRTTLVVLPALALVYGFHRFGWKGLAGAVGDRYRRRRGGVDHVTLSARPRDERLHANQSIRNQRGEHFYRRAHRVLDQVAELRRQRAAARPWHRLHHRDVSTRRHRPHRRARRSLHQSPQSHLRRGHPDRHCRRGGAVGDVALTALPVSRPRTCSPGSGSWWWCRTLSARCSIRSSSISRKAGYTSSASVSLQVC